MLFSTFFYALCRCAFCLLGLLPLLPDMAFSCISEACSGVFVLSSCAILLHVTIPFLVGNTAPENPEPGETQKGWLHKRGSSGNDNEEICFNSTNTYLSLGHAFLWS